MKLNNIKNIAPVAALVLTMGLSSCVKDLDVTPIDPNSVSQVDEPSLYTKCYANMALAGNGGANGDCDIDGLDGGTTGFVRQLWNANELTTDEAICAWGDTGIPAFNRNEYDASHPMLRGFYNRLYTGIAYCNHYLDECGGIDATRTAEVRFIRALYYYHLMDCWGNVPFADHLMTTPPAQIARPDLFKWIEDELLECLPLLREPEALTSAKNYYGTVDQDAANLLLARMYLNAEVYTGKAQWDNALKYAKDVIKGPHKLWDQGVGEWSAYQMLFMGDNGETGASREAILPLLQDGKTTTSWGTTLFLMASTWKEDMNINSDYNSSAFWAGNRARKAFIDIFFPDGDAPQETIENMVLAAHDDRALFFGVDRELKVSNPGEFTSGYSVGKFRNTYTTGAPGHSSQFADTDFFLMRSAEAYLIAAEADARLHGGMTSEEGAGYINQIRNRAHATTYKQYSTRQILDERARELYHEGHRRTDLIRFGLYGGEKSADYVWEWKGGAENGRGFAAYLNLFAIPDEDKNANPNLEQNIGY